MAVTWKKVLTEDSSVNLSQLVTASNSVLIANGSGGASSVSLAENQILVSGGASSDPISAPIAGGDVTGTLNGSSQIELTIQPGAVEHAMLAEDSINLENIADSDTFSGGSAHSGLLVFGDGTTAKTPTFLTANGNGSKILAVNSGANGFEFVSASSASDVDVNSATGSSALAVMFGAANDASDDGSGVQVLKQANANEFTYKPDVSTFAVAAATNDITGTDSTLHAPASPTAALKVKGGIEGHLAGTATSAQMIQVADASSIDGFKNVIFTNTGSGHKPVGIDTGLQYNPAEETLKVKNLQVTGTNTAVETQNLLIEDKIIRVGTTSAGVDAATANNSGIVVNVGVSTLTSSDENNASLNQTNDDDHLPRLVWGDQDLSESTLGWQLANVGVATANAGVADGDGNIAVPANSVNASNAYGVAVLKHQTDDINLATALGAGGANATDIGVGAFLLCTGGTNPGLFIQTEV